MTNVIEIYNHTPFRKNERLRRDPGVGMHMKRLRSGALACGLMVRECDGPRRRAIAAVPGPVLACLFRVGRTTHYATEL